MNRTTQVFEIIAVIVLVIIVVPIFTSISLGIITIPVLVITHTSITFHNIVGVLDYAAGFALINMVLSIPPVVLIYLLSRLGIVDLNNIKNTIAFFLVSLGLTYLIIYPVYLEWISGIKYNLIDLLKPGFYWISPTQSPLRISLLYLKLIELFK